jgi:hypothetical protein
MRKLKGRGDFSNSRAEPALGIEADYAADVPEPFNAAKAHFDYGQDV